MELIKKIENIQENIKHLKNLILNKSKRHILNKKDSEAFDIVFDSIELIVEQSSILDKNLYTRVEYLLNENKFEDKLLHLKSELIFDENTTITSNYKLHPGLASEMENLLFKLNRYFDSLKRKIENFSQQDEILTPHNTDKEFLVKQIDLAIGNIENSVIRSEEQKQIIFYLQETKIEIAKDKPSWKKVIGGIVIAAAIISAIADSDKAIENLNKAYTHIIGRSVTQSVPSILNPLKPIDFRNHSIEYDDTKEVTI